MDANQKKRYMIFAYLFIVFGSCLVILNTQLPSAVGGMYSRGETGFLNNISFTSETEIRPVDYYVGKIEDLWLGPLTSVVSGGLFLLFCLWFLQGAGRTRFAVAVLLYLLLSRFQVLFNPPYGDGLFGVLSEPLWLVRHHFDWISLLHQKTYVWGGPVQYPESIYPQFIALLLYFSSSPPIFLFLNHLLVFSAGAILVALVREILMEFFDARRATLGAILFLALPIIQCHVELLNMEIVCSCFAAGALLMAMRNNVFMASALATFSMMVKVSGAFTVAMLLGACLLSFFKEPHKKKIMADIFWVLGACAIALYLLSLRAVAIGHANFSLTPARAALRLMPSLFIFRLFLFLSVFYLGQCIFWWISGGTPEKKGNVFLNGHYKSLTVFMITAAWFLLHLKAPTMIPRYTVLVIPFILSFFVYLFSGLVKKDIYFTRTMVALILFALLCSHGLLFIGQPVNGEVNHNERSLEYRNVLAVYRRTAEEIEKNGSSFAFVGDILMAQILFFKEAGYIRKSPENVFVYGSGATHEGIRMVDELQGFKSFEVLWIAETSADPHYLADFPIAPEDTILKEIWAGDKRITLFVGGLSILRLGSAMGRSLP